jgi:hypothetical protein
MSVRGVLEKDVLIRLTESGFVETVRFFGLPDRCVTWETAAPELGNDPVNDAQPMWVRMPERRDEKTRSLDSPQNE